MEMTEAYRWRGRTVLDRNGDKIGKVEEVYVDEVTEAPEWALVEGGLLSKKRHLVPLRDASPVGEDVRVPFDKSRVEAAPAVDPEPELSQEDEERLYHHYGFEYSEARSESGLPEEPGPATATETTEAGDAVTRSEEELRVGTERRERGRVRLRKYVVTEHENRTVPVRREEVRVEREPVSEADAGQATREPDMSEQEQEVVLHEEVPVVEKRTVPKERLRLEKEPVVEEAQVSEEVRKEQIETEGEERPDAR